jgi:hypothetical protein
VQYLMSFHFFSSSKLLANACRPDQLILPYDPGFVPELSLPGLGIDFSNLVSVTGVKHLPPDCSLLSKTSSNASQISSQDLIIPQLDISSSSLNLGEIDGPHMMSGALIEAAHPAIDPGNESGILLQPDFEFDEEGNIVDLFGTGIRESVSRPQTLSPSGNLRAHSLLPGSHLQPTENVSWLSSDLLLDLHKFDKILFIDRGVI